MRVFKFGGASVKDAEAVKNLLNVLEQQEKDEKLLIVISAMGKMTNAFEELFQYVWDCKDYTQEWNLIKNYHLKIAKELFEDESSAIENMLETIFSEIGEIIGRIQTEKLSYNQSYDSLIVYGELLSTKLVAFYLNQSNQSFAWLDAREVIKTDNQWREALVDWDKTEKEIQKKVLPLMTQKTIITQGFIGQTKEGQSTTLGREGSDFSAAIFAYCLNAESVVIWKDVPGVLNADPKIVKDAYLYAQLSYQEAAEMSYLGASVIHPKTIAPLEKKNISLYVKSFLNPKKTGTCIDKTVAKKVLPGIIFKKNVYLIQLEKKEFGFLTISDYLQILTLLEKNQVSVLFAQQNIKSMSFCITHTDEELNKQLQLLKKEYNLYQFEEVQLISIKNPDNEAIQIAKQMKKILVEQHCGELYQAVSL